MTTTTAPALPLALWLAVEAPQPSLADNTADLDRLKRALRTPLRTLGMTGRTAIPFDCQAKVAAGFRNVGFRGQALVNLVDEPAELVDFVAERPRLLAAMALDLGTTFLEASLVDLFTGAVLGRGHGENRQMAHGADILTRIHHATATAGGAAELRTAVVESINRLAGELAAGAGLAAAELRGLAVSGNTTMVHLLLGLSPYHICREPYTPLVNAPDPCHARDLGLDLHPLAPVYFLPSVGSYFGGDLISGILASDLDRSEATRMLIDVGTNAEVVLGNRDYLIACAGAAGPALEGGVARMGMRAGPGAIEHVSIDRDGIPRIQTMDQAPARGICGSGLIDLVAGLYLARVIDLRGKLRSPDSPGIADGLRGRIVLEDGVRAFVVVPVSEAADGRAVTLGQIDVDAIMRSKAAMYAILTTLAAQVGVEFAELERIVVAGAFGRHIDPRLAIVLGMLPDLPMEVFETIGNSSLRGAEIVALQGAARARAREIGGRITYVELNVNQEFMIRFSGSRFIPHTDPGLFPSVPSFRDKDQGDAG